MSSAKKAKFILSRQNQKGQVAIFVALIFQVIFVMFALLINVGLLVHHKINLQHSTDIAAYYGAMKQAESLNAIAHINFQIRQAWKLLAWRYRIMGTFGIIRSGAADQQIYPFNAAATPSPYKYNGPDATQCASPAGASIQDLPYLCPGHAGLKDWPAQTENHCQMSCSNFNVARDIKHISSVGGQSIFGESFGVTLDASIDNVNKNLTDLCLNLSKFSVEMIAKFLMSYIHEVRPRKLTIDMLAKNLSGAADQMVDLDGNKILDGTKKTLENNLTEANLTGMKGNAQAIVTFNSIDQGNGGVCKYDKGDGLKNNSTEFLKRIEFKLINYFIAHCGATPGSSNIYNMKPVFESSSLNPVVTSGPAAVSSDIKDILESFLTDQNMHTIGYEKNPNCSVYYAVKSTTEPLIPFLPLKKIKLNAVAVAKPFGGSIGPSFGTNWPQGSPRSDFTNADENTFVDKNMPIRDLPSDAPLVEGITQSIRRLINFSKFVGDAVGLRDPEYVGTYHALLATRNIKFPTNVNNGPDLGANGTNDWPKLDNYRFVQDATAGLNSYDPMATSFTRSLEITAISPNQFDVTYYSIDPDFFHNYFLRLSNGNIFSKIKAAAGGVGPASEQDIRPDFGAKLNVAELSASPTPVATYALIPAKDFSVRDQINFTRDFFDFSPSGVNSFSGTYLSKFKYILTKQASLLTGWTFKNFQSFSSGSSGSFPSPTNQVDFTENTMTFGSCKDPWNDSSANDDSARGRPTDQNLPPTPGNCVTGGRTGYSVKLVSPKVVLDGALMENPMDSSFFIFQ